MGLLGWVCTWVGGCELAVHLLLTCCVSGKCSTPCAALSKIQASPGLGTVLLLTVLLATFALGGARGELSSLWCAACAALSCARAEQSPRCSSGCNKASQVQLSGQLLRRAHGRTLYLGGRGRNPQQSSRPPPSPAHCATTTLLAALASQQRALLCTGSSAALGWCRRLLTQLAMADAGAAAAAKAKP